MIPRFDTAELIKLERNKKGFSLALRLGLAKLYFESANNNKPEYLVRATPSQLYHNLTLSDGRLVSIFLVPFPLQLKPDTIHLSASEQEMVADYQKKALTLLGIPTEDLFYEAATFEQTMSPFRVTGYVDYLSYTTYFDAIQSYSGSKITLSRPLEDYAKTLLGGKSSALVPLKKSTKLVMGMRPLIVWNRTVRPLEIFALTKGLGLPILDKPLQVRTQTGVGSIEPGKELLTLLLEKL